MQALPEYPLSTTFHLLTLKDLGRASQVCKYWREVSCLAVQASCNSLRIEINNYLEKMNEIFQEDKIGPIDKFLKQAEETKTKLILSMDEIQQQIAKWKDENTEGDMEARWARELELDDVVKKIKNCVKSINATESQKRDLISYRKIHLPKTSPDICNEQNSPGIYVFHFNKKLALFTEIFSFCTSETDGEEWKKKLPKVTDLTLSESKLSLKDLVKEKIENFRAYVKPHFESEENFTKFQGFSKFHELMGDNVDKNLVNVESFFNNRIESLIEQPDALNALMPSFSYLRECIPFLVEQPHQQQIIDDMIRPFPRVQAKIGLLTKVRIGMEIINADTQATVQDAIDEEKKSVRITVNWVCFPTVYLTNALNTNDNYKFHIIIGPYSILTRTFKMVSQSSDVEQ